MYVDVCTESSLRTCNVIPRLRAKAEYKCAVIHFQHGKEVIRVMPKCNHLFNEKHYSANKAKLITTKSNTSLVSLDQQNL